MGEQGGDGQAGNNESKGMKDRKLRMKKILHHSLLCYSPETVRFSPVSHGALNQHATGGVLAELAVVAASAVVHGSLIVDSAIGYERCHGKDEVALPGFSEVVLRLFQDLCRQDAGGRKREGRISQSFWCTRKLFTTLPETQPPTDYEVSSRYAHYFRNTVTLYELKGFHVAPLQFDWNE